MHNWTGFGSVFLWVESELYHHGGSIQCLVSGMSVSDRTFVMDVDHVLTLHHSLPAVCDLPGLDGQTDRPGRPGGDTASQEQVEGQDRNPIIRTAETLPPHRPPHPYFHCLAARPASPRPFPYVNISTLWWRWLTGGKTGGDKMSKPSGGAIDSPGAPQLKPTEITMIFSLNTKTRRWVGQRS